MGNMVDMANTEKQQETAGTPLMPEPDKYPYGLRINLNKEELAKLDVDHSDWEIGDVFALDVLVKVVSKSSNESEGGEENCCVSLQITHIGAEEHEDVLEEAEEEEPSLERHGYLRYSK